MSTAYLADEDIFSVGKKKTSKTTSVKSVKKIADSIANDVKKPLVKVNVPKKSKAKETQDKPKVQTEIVLKGKKTTKKVQDGTISLTKKSKKKIDEDDTLDMSPQEAQRQFSDSESDCDEEGKGYRDIITNSEDESPFVLQRTKDMDEEYEDFEFDVVKPMKKPANPQIIDETKFEKRTREFLELRKKLDAIEQTVLDIQDDPDSIDVKELVDTLELLEKAWTPDDISDDSELDFIVKQGLNIDNSDPTPFEVQTAMEQVVHGSLIALRMRFLHANMIESKDYADSKKWEHKFNHISMLQTYYCEMFYNKVMVKNRLKNPEMDFTTTGIGLLRYLPRQDEEGMSECCKMLMYCLLKLQQRRLRRFKGGIFRPIYTKDGHFTNAWEEDGTIEEFVWGCVDIDRQRHVFKTMYHRGASIPEQLIKILKYIRTSYFPELKVDRYLSSWNNGIYDLMNNKFYPYGSGNPFTRGNVRQDDKVESQDLESMVEELKRVGNILKDFRKTDLSVEITEKGIQSAHELRSAKDTKANGSSDKPLSDRAALLVNDIQRVKTTVDKLSDVIEEFEKVKPALKDLKKISKKLPKFGTVFSSIAKELEGSKGDTSGCVFTGSNFCSSIYKPQEFIDQTHVKWTEIETPAFQTILDSQEFHMDTQAWFYAILGRGLYWCGEYAGENWQIAPYILGQSGTGKSTALKNLRQFFRLENVGILSNNIETQWAMSSLIDKHVVIGYEIKGNFKWDQAEFQQCAACEELLVAEKHKNAYITQWRTPIFMAANEMITRWKDSSGSLKRRLLIFPFNKFVPPAHINPNLMNELNDEYSLWIQKINMAYQDFASDYGSVDIWSVVSKELQDASSATMQSVNVMEHFFAEKSYMMSFGSPSDTVQPYCSEKEFLSNLEEFCNNMGYEYKKLKWGPDLYRQAFAQRNLQKVNTRTEIVTVKRGGQTEEVEKNVPGNWIVGVSFVKQSEPIKIAEGVPPNDEDDEKSEEK